MAKNTLADLNNILFEELERLNDEELQGEKLTQEMNRAKAMTGVATQVVMNARTILDAAKFQDDKMDIDTPVPALLTGGGAEVDEQTEKIHEGRTSLHARVRSGAQLPRDSRRVPEKIRR